jgi:Ca2+-binding EF-hand superfamily protein
VLDKMRTQINARGATTIRGLGRVFRAMDSYDGNKKVTADEFRVALGEVGVVCTKAESDTLLKLLDTDGDGNINFDEFLIGVRVSI